MKLLYESDASLDPLQGKTVTVLGYGNQGRAQALNLRDSGIKVVVGNRDDEYRKLAVKEGWEPVTIPEAAAAGDILLVLTTDECMPLIWDDQIAPGIAPGNMLCWSSGYNIGYGLIQLPADVDAVMIAPMMPGNMVRTLFERGTGVVGQFAVEQDSSGQAREIVLGLCKGMGLTRVGVYESSFMAEAHLNLFTEQVVWPGIAAWFVECFELAVREGLDPEAVVMALYASGESAEILGLTARYGFFKQMRYHSTTSQYGTLSRAKTIISDSMREQARKNFVDDIKGGRFVKEWTVDSKNSSARLKELWDEALAHPMSQAEARVIELLEAAHTADGQTGGSPAID